jgi:hypothetical protein
MRKITCCFNHYEFKFLQSKTTNQTINHKREGFVKNTQIDSDQYKSIGTYKDDLVKKWRYLNGNLIKKNAIIISIVKQNFNKNRTKQATGKKHKSIELPRDTLVLLWEMEVL